MASTYLSVQIHIKVSGNISPGNLQFTPHYIDMSKYKHTSIMDKCLNRLYLRVHTLIRDREAIKYRQTGVSKFLDSFHNRLYLHSAV